MAVDRDDHLLVSARHTWAIHKIDRSSGEMRWRLGGKRGEFAMAPGGEFSWQHDARRQADGTPRLLDNRAGITTEADQSRGWAYRFGRTGRPTDQPAVAVRTGRGAAVTVHVSTGHTRGLRTERPVTAPVLPAP